MEQPYLVELVIAGVKAVLAGDQSDRSYSTSSRSLFGDWMIFCVQRESLNCCDHIQRHTAYWRGSIYILLCCFIVHILTPLLHVKGVTASSMTTQGMRYRQPQLWPLTLQITLAKCQDEGQHCCFRDLDVKSRCQSIHCHVLVGQDGAINYSLL